MYFHVAGDFNINIHDREIWKKIQHFSNIIYPNGIIPIITIPFSVTNKQQ